MARRSRMEARTDMLHARYIFKKTSRIRRACKQSGRSNCHVYQLCGVGEAGDGGGVGKAAGDDKAVIIDA